MVRVKLLAIVVGAVVVMGILAYSLVTTSASQDIEFEGGVIHIKLLAIDTNGRSIVLGEKPLNLGTITYKGQEIVAIAYGLSITSNSTIQILDESQILALLGGNIVRTWDIQPNEIVANVEEELASVGMTANEIESLATSDLVQMEFRMILKWMFQSTMHITEITYPSVVFEIQVTIPPICPTAEICILTGTFTGTVIDADSLVGLVGVSVITSDQTVQTDSVGHYEMDLTSGLRSVTFAKTGYLSITLLVDIPENATLDMAIYMIPTDGGGGGGGDPPVILTITGINFSITIADRVF